MGQRYFIDSWLLPCSLRSHRIANPTPKNGLRHFSALHTHHPAGGGHVQRTMKQGFECYAEISNIGHIPSKRKDVILSLFSKPK